MPALISPFFESASSSSKVFHFASVFTNRPGGLADHHAQRHDVGELAAALPPASVASVSPMKSAIAWPSGGAESSLAMPVLPVAPGTLSIGIETLSSGFEQLAHAARELVGAAAGAPGHDELDRTRRIFVLSMHERRQHRACGSTGAGNKQPTADHYR